MREIILDTETTGLDPYQGHRIIEIGCLEMVNKVLTGRSFHCHINPERDVPLEAFNIHGLSTEFLQDKPKIVEVISEFLAFIENSHLVIHNASFDMKFLNYELSILNIPSLSMEHVVDTLQVARSLFPGTRNNLDALCKRFKIDNSDRQYHGALKDAKLLAEVYVELTGGRQVKLEINADPARELSYDNIKNESQLSDINFKVYSPTVQEKLDHQKLLSRIANNLWYT